MKFATSSADFPVFQYGLLHICYIGKGQKSLLIPCSTYYIPSFKKNPFLILHSRFSLIDRLRFALIYRAAIS